MNGSNGSEVPVCNPGETLDDWINRAKPYLIQALSLSEDQALAMAKIAWEKTNSPGDKPPQAQQAQPGDKPPQAQQAQPGDKQPSDKPPQAQQAQPGDKQPSDKQPSKWGEPDNWGASLLNPGSNDQPPESNGAGPAERDPAGAGDAGLSMDLPNEIDKSDANAIAGWFSTQIANATDTFLAGLSDSVPGDILDQVEAIIAGDAAAEPHPDKPMAEKRAEDKNPFASKARQAIRSYWRSRQDDPDDQRLERWMGIKGIEGPMIDPRGESLMSDLAIKSLGPNRIGSYLVVWGNPQNLDFSQQYFTKSTTGLTDIFDEIGKIPALYHHAIDNRIKSTVLGLVDTMQRDDIGLWVEAQIVKAREYQQMIRPLIDQAKMGWSSGTLPYGSRVAKATGEILHWPIVEASITPTPMEWRMVAQWPIGHIKAAYSAAGLPADSINKLVQFAQAQRNDPAAYDLALERERARYYRLAVR